MATKIVDLGRVVGADGAAGAAGKSAYQSAVEAGYTGTEAEFYAALVAMQDAPFLPLSGGTMNDNSQIKINLGILTAPVRGSSFEGLACMSPSGGFAPMWVGTPNNNQHAANKKYVDDAVANVGGDFATKEYVENLADQVRSEAFKAAAKIACWVTVHSDGSEDRSNVKLTPVNLLTEDYSLELSGTVAYNTKSIRLEPPPGYAFTGLAHTWMPAMKMGAGGSRVGASSANGAIIFEFQSSDVGQSFALVSMELNSSPARFILEVA